MQATVVHRQTPERESERHCKLKYNCSIFAYYTLNFELQVWDWCVWWWCNATSTSPQPVHCLALWICWAQTSKFFDLRHCPLAEQLSLRRRSSPVIPADGCQHSLTSRAEMGNLPGLADASGCERRSLPLPAHTCPLVELKEEGCGYVCAASLGSV